METQDVCNIAIMATFGILFVLFFWQAIKVERSAPFLDISILFGFLAGVTAFFAIRMIKRLFSFLRAGYAGHRLI